MPPDELIRYLNAAAAEGVPDAELLRRAAAGDEAAFELLMRRHAGLVWRVCRAVARDHHAAEDAFQASFLALARKAGTVRGESVAGWLGRVAYHAALKARAVAGLPGDPASVRTRVADDPLERAELAAVLHEELARLGDAYRAPLVLCYLEGFTHAEAAASLGWPVGTVATRIARGRDRLRDRLTRRGFALSAGAVVAVLSAEPASALPELAPVSAASPALHRLAREALSAMTRPKRTAVASLALVLAAGTAIALAASGQPPADPKEPPPVKADAPKPPDKERPQSVVVIGRFSGIVTAIHTVADADRIAALEKCFPDYRKRPSSPIPNRVDPGWFRYEVYFNFPGGETIRVLVSDPKDRQARWTVGRGDFPLAGDLPRFLTDAPGDQVTAAGAGWSKPVNGLIARALLERGREFNGTPIITAYLEVRNVSESAEPIRFPIESARWAWTLTDADGNAVPTTGGPFDEVRVPTPTLILPPGSTIRVNVSHTGYGVRKDQGGHLDLGDANWSFTRGDPKEYSLGGKLEIRGKDEKEWSGTLELPKVRVPTKAE